MKRTINLHTLLRRNQIQGPKHKGHRYRPGLQAKNGWDMKITPHNNELEALREAATRSVLKAGSGGLFSEDIDSSIRFMQTKAVGDPRKTAQPSHPPTES